MTIDQLKGILSAVDPNIRRHFTTDETENFTVWGETRRIFYHADNRNTEVGFAFSVHRYTRLEDDPMVDALYAALNGAADSTVKWETEPIPAYGYIHHTLSCTCLL